MEEQKFQFGPFRLDLSNQLLLREDTPIPLAPKAFDTLAYLLRKSGRLVTRDELMKAVWPDSFVEDANLTVNISLLRKALGETDSGKPYIETVPRKGYRFNAPVVTLEAEPPGVPRSLPVILQPGDLKPASPALRDGERDKQTKPAFQSASTAGGWSSPAGGISRQPALPEIIPFPEPGRAPEPEPMPRPAQAQGEVRERWIANQGGQDAGAPGSAAVPAIFPTRWWMVASLALVVAVAVAGWLLWRHPQPVQQLAERRLTSFAPEMAVTAAAISSGGKFIAYANPSGLFVQVIATGDTQPLALPSPRFQVSNISWFPDSARLLVAGSNPGDATPSLWVVPVIGTGPLGELGPYPPGVVSPDGSEIAWVNNRGAVPEIQLMRSAGGSIKTLVTGARDEVFGSVSWSPTGRRLFFTGYSWNPQFRGNSGSIDSCNIGSGKTTTVLSGRDFGGDVIGLPDGRLVYSKTLGASASAYGSEILSVRTNPRTGLATGSPWLIAKWSAPVTGLSVNARGTQLIFRDLVVQNSAYVGELERGEESLNDVRRLSFGVGREDFPSAWTPDSRALFLDSNRSGNWEIYKQTIESDSDQPFVEGPDDQFSPRVSPDGAWLLYIDRPRTWREPQPVSLMRVPISGGLPQLVLKASHFSEWGLRFECPRRPGMPCVLAQRQGNQVVFRAFDPEEGFQDGSKELARTDYVGRFRAGWCLAPDGLSIAWIRMGPTDNQLYVVP